MTADPPLVHLPPWPADHDQLAAKLEKRAGFLENRSGITPEEQGHAKLMREAANCIRALVANYDHTVLKMEQERQKAVQSIAQSKASNT